MCIRDRFQPLLPADNRPLTERTECTVLRSIPSAADRVGGGESAIPGSADGAGPSGKASPMPGLGAGDTGDCWACALIATHMHRHPSSSRKRPGTERMYKDPDVISLFPRIAGRGPPRPGQPSRDER